MAQSLPSQSAPASVADWDFSAKAVPVGLSSIPDDPRVLGSAKAPPGDLVTWYRQPAKRWIDALPLGNGRLGAMVYGGINREKIGLNEDTLWAGGPYQPAVHVPRSTLEEIQKLHFDGKHLDAQRLAEKLQGQPNAQAPYQTLGEFKIDFPDLDAGEVQDYRRSLNLDTAVSSVSFYRDGVLHTREVFVSPVDQAVVVRLTTSKRGGLSFFATFATPLSGEVTSEGEDTVVLTGRNDPFASRDHARIYAPSSLTFHTRARVVVEGGSISSKSGRVAVSNADAALIFITAASSYKRYNDITGDPDAITREALSRVCSKTYETIRTDHVAEHARLFGRVKLNLGRTTAGDLPTDERIDNFIRHDDPSLAALYFQFGRYLLISSSRPGSQPANLQGIWNNQATAPWDSKYTVNINTEMNYWIAQTTNLAEVEEPLFRMLADIAETGAVTARNTYNARGWVLHHNTDLWRASAPMSDSYWGMWPTGGAWLMNHLYQSYLFSADTAYLEKLYPLMKSSAEFFLDTLVEHPKYRWLVTNPSNSPENEIQRGVTNTAGPTMDMAILRELFTNLEEASKILDRDSQLRAEVRAARERLAPYQVGVNGQLQEWLDDIDTKVPEIQHRHMSPLYGLFPGNDITPANPRIFSAARKLAEMRGYLNSEGMGWAVAWRVNLWARLMDSERAYAFFENLISTKTEKNLFDKPVTQLDGNFGGASGLVEMLLQSHEREGGVFVVNLLPALPVFKWPSGSITGLRARGGYELDMTWKEGRLEQVTLHSKSGSAIKLRYQGRTIEVQIPVGQSRTIPGAHFN